MNDSLALEAAAPLAEHSTLPGSISSPTLATSIPAPKACRAPSPAGNALSPSSVPAVIAGRLRVAAPDLLSRANAATKARLIHVLRKRLGGLISNALSAFQSQVGELAASLDAEECRRLQDLALSARPRADDLVARTVEALSPSELAANLAAACEAHAPDGIDALRCRDLVYGGRDLLAREAMLDLACLGQTDRSRGMIERLVADHMIKEFESVNSLKPSTIDQLRSHCLASEGPGATTSARARLDKQSIEGELLQAIRQGRNQSATVLLAAASGVSRATVDAAICLRSAKGLMSLSWRAGLDAAFSVTVQSALGRLPPDQVLHPTQQGDFPLTAPEMLWHCRLLDHSQRASAG